MDSLAPARSALAGFWLRPDSFRRLPGDSSHKICNVIFFGIGLDVRKLISLSKTEECRIRTGPGQVRVSPTESNRSDQAKAVQPEKSAKGISKPREHFEPGRLPVGDTAGYQPALRTKCDGSSQVQVSPTKSNLGKANQTGIRPDPSQSE